MSINDHSGMQACASLYLRRAGVPGDWPECPESVAAAIALMGREQFERWANFYLAEGCGVPG